MSISKREKIIVSLALLAALAAGGRFLFSGSTGRRAQPEAQDKPADAFLMEVAQSLAQYRLTETETAILEKAESPWPARPFVQAGTSSGRSRSDASTQASGTVPGNFSYTGYIEAGSRRLAIIGGTEYEIGDRVADTPLTVRGISPEQVLLEDADGRRYTAPLQDGSVRNAAQILLQSE